MPEQLIGYGLARIDEEANLIEWFEPVTDNNLSVYPDIATAKNERGDRDPGTWQIVQVSLVDERAS